MATMSSSSGSLNRWIKAALVVAAAGLSGCIVVTPEECRTANWYDMGEHDGNWYGVRPRIDLLAYQCEAQGVKAPESAEKDYMVGWVDGYREWTKRVHASDCCGP